MAKLYFNDPITKEAIPLRILVVGPAQAGKKTFLQRIKNRFTAFDYDHYFNFRSHHHGCFDAPPDVDLSGDSVMEFFTHIFYIDAGERVNRRGYAIEFNPDNMYLVDNSRGINEFEVEIEHCIELMKITME